MRVCLAFHAQSEFLDEPKCVERGITPTFQRAAARLQTREPREMRTEKLTSVKLILNHSLLVLNISVTIPGHFISRIWVPDPLVILKKLSPHTQYIPIPLYTV